MSKFLQDFSVKYNALLANRYNTFYKIFEYLERLDKKKYFIVETGMARQENNYGGDGLSTILFDEYLNYRDGKIISVDISPQVVSFAASKISSKAELICSDSVSYLYNLSKQETPKLDLLYLDSFDLSWDNPHPSSLHHVKELLAIMHKVTPGTLIVVDDNNRGAGKGQYIADFMENTGKVKYFDEYQIGWIW